MRYLLLLLLLPAFLWGAKILSYNIYDRNDRVDVMLTFDTPYEGVLRQNRQGNTVIVKLEEAFIEDPKVKNVNSKYLNKLTISPQDEHIEIIAEVSNDVVMQASKTSDSNALVSVLPIPYLPVWQEKLHRLMKLPSEQSPLKKVMNLNKAIMS